MGFVPIGSLAMPFNGHFDGNWGSVGTVNQFSEGRISGIAINRPNQNYVGLFGVTGANAVLSNILLSGLAVTGGNYVGGLVGLNQGQINNIGFEHSFVVGNNNVGLISGVNTKTISNVFSFADRLLGNVNVGGITGINTGTISDAIIANYMHGNANVGALAGLNTGSIVDSFWDTDVTGSLTPTGANTGVLSHDWAGCIGGFPTCTNGGFVDLSDMKSFLTHANGGYGLVSQSWNQSIWSITPGYSYPYSKAVFGSDAQVYSGNLSTPSANQIIGLFYGVTQVKFTNFDLTGAKFYTMITGADGSFYNVSNEIASGTPVALLITGGSYKGSIAFANPSDNLINPSGSIRGLLIPTSPRSDPQPTDNSAVNLLTVLGLFDGFTLDQLAGFTPSTGGTQAIFGNLVAFQKALSQYIGQNNDNYSLEYYYLNSGGNTIKIYTSVEDNIREIINGTFLDNMNAIKHYEIHELARSCHV